jgi:hypothetical protein
MERVGTSDMDGEAARVAASESGDERVQSLNASVLDGLDKQKTARDVSRSTRCARSGQALKMAAAPLLDGCNVTLLLDMTEFGGTRSPNALVE